VVGLALAGLVAYRWREQLWHPDAAANQL
jgi:hypothetical protein